MFSFLYSAQVNIIAKDRPKDEKSDKKEDTDNKIFNGLPWRSIGPAMTSGRIADFAVNPENKSEWFVAVASGNVWKTENNGTTFKPVFDKYGSYSTGCITIDPNNSSVIWLGTGENNHQRALGYGDGVYKSEDGGGSWENMGLKESRQIGNILVDPRNSDIVFVAAEGSAWGPGGDRGLYKSTDRGKNWRKVLEISENTGVNNIIMDPVDPDLMYATSEQRRRHVFTKIGGGPESAVYRSMDGGETWDKTMKGLPSVDLGGMGIAVSPADHNVIYLIAEAAEDKGGFFRSTDRGASWERMSNYSSSGQYYNEIYCDPVDVNSVYSMDTYSKVTRDGGRTWKNVGNDNRHVDDHALWIDPADTDHFMIGGDGGVYESFDDGKTYLFKRNLPVTQFYRVFVDNSKPFYYVYGGTQDNNTLGGPSQNTSRDGVSSEEWKAVLGGDGFWVAVDPEDPDIVYCESQYGNISRYDRKSGENISIKPRPRKGEKTYKWNWNAPLAISHHSHTRLYTMANKLFRSEDRGNTWEVISGDLTSQTDRNTWPVMGKFWSYDAVAKDVSTSLWGTGVSFSESPIDENLLYTGTDDGVISVTQNGGEEWYRVNVFPGIPEYTYVSDLLADRFDSNIVYATFDNRKRDDFTPYILKSDDMGKTWTSISSNLPENGTVHTIFQDPEEKNLLFVGTEFGCYFTLNAGEEWIKLSSGIPTISVKDITIQEQENDLVIATFGRGFYILDDITPLRSLARDPSILEKESHLFPVPDAEMFAQTSGKYGQGSNFYRAENPPFGAVFTYFLKETPKTLTQERREKEKELFKEGKPIPQPSLEQLNKEKEEEKPYLLFTVYDQEGNIVRKIKSTPKKGINRVSWDLRYSSPRPLRQDTPGRRSSSSRSGGTLIMPGSYSVDIQLFHRDKMTALEQKQSFRAIPLGLASLPATDETGLIEFQKQASELSRVMMGAENLAGELKNKLSIIETAIDRTPSAGTDLLNTVRRLGNELDSLLFILEGPPAKASWEELPPMEMPLDRRLNVLIRTHWSSTSELSQTERDQLTILQEEFPPVMKRLKEISEEIQSLENKLEQIHAPWTPGRIPVYDPDAGSD